MKKDKRPTMALCLNCSIALENVGYEAEAVGEGMIVCQNCGKKCWGKTVRLEKTRKEAERE